MKEEISKHLSNLYKETLLTSINNILSNKLEVETINNNDLSTIEKKYIDSQNNIETSLEDGIAVNISVDQIKSLTTLIQPLISFTSIKGVFNGKEYTFQFAKMQALRIECRNNKTYLVVRLPISQGAYNKSLNIFPIVVKGRIDISKIEINGVLIDHEYTLSMHIDHNELFTLPDVYNLNNEQKNSGVDFEKLFKTSIDAYINTFPKDIALFKIKLPVNIEKLLPIKILLSDFNKGDKNIVLRCFYNTMNNSPLLQSKDKQICLKTPIFYPYIISSITDTFHIDKDVFTIKDNKIISTKEYKIEIFIQKEKHPDIYEELKNNNLLNEDSWSFYLFLNKTEIYLSKNKLNVNTEVRLKLTSYFQIYANTTADISIVNDKDCDLFQDIKLKIAPIEISFNYKIPEEILKYINRALNYLIGSMLNKFEHNEWKYADCIKWKKIDLLTDQVLTLEYE